ncbi:MAG: hypothetical protein S4CHLAM20_09950 [Chlamydiia bacterium]|nr:hypothetical protein [Chlamydiia bacterium]
MEATAKRPPPLHLTSTLEHSDEEEELLEEIPLTERTKAYFTQIQTYLEYNKAAKDYYHHFTQTIPQDALKNSTQNAITELIYFLFPETRKGKVSPAPEQIREKLPPLITRASRDDVLITLETIATYLSLEKIQTSSGKEIEVSNLKSIINPDDPEKSFHDIVKANNAEFLKVDMLYFKNKTIKILPRALCRLPNLKTLKFFNCSIRELPYWVGDLNLDALGIWNLDETAFKITRFIGNLTNLISLKLWTPLANSLNPLIRLKSLMRLELPEFSKFQFEFPQELRELPAISRIALDRTECSKSL